MIENGVRKRCSSIVCVVGVLASPAAWAGDLAQTPLEPTPGGIAPPAQPSPPAPAAEPGAPPSGIVPSSDPSASAPAAAEVKPEQAAPAPPEEAAPSIPSYFRMDIDSTGLQLWAGALHTIGPISLSSDIYVMTSGYAEFDIGPFLTFGLVSILPEVGIGFDFINHRSATLVAPQLYTYVDAQPVYFESWLNTQFNSVFTEGTQNYFYTRDFLLFSVIDVLAIGPHVELTVDLNETQTPDVDPTLPAIVDDAGLSSLQVGGAIKLSYGTGNKLLLYLGHETQEESQVGGKLAGRFTFVHSF